MLQEIWKKDDKGKENTYSYSAKIKLTTGGNFGYTFRVMPKHEIFVRIRKYEFSKMDDKIIFKRNLFFRLKYYLFINNINIIIIENTKYNKKNS